MFCASLFRSVAICAGNTIGLRAVGSICFIATMGSAAHNAPYSNRVLLRPLSSAEVRAAGISGTGCSWFYRGSLRFAMAGDRAVAKVNGAIVDLAPGSGAKDFFPFTYDRWRSGQTTITVRRIGQGRQINAESLQRVADLLMIVGKTRSVVRGSMICGS